MENLNKITCPKCGHGFHAEQALAQPIEEKIRAEFNQRFKVLQSKVHQEAEEKIIQERGKLEEDLKKKLLHDNEIQMKAIAEDLDKKSRELRELKIKEVEFLKMKKELEEQKQEMELQLQKRLLEESKAIEEKARKKSEEESHLRLREKDMQLETLKKQIDEMKRKAEQGSMQLQGEVQEIALEELLKEAFPFDLIEEVGKGVRGADVIQTVRNNYGKECGRIVYESKRTKAFSDGWIDKIKNDLRASNADLAVIVTETLPKEMDRFGIKEGVWICGFTEIKGVSLILRDSLIKIHSARSAEENKGEKMQMMYDFLTGKEFRQQMEAIVEAYVTMKENLEKEKRGMLKIWAERDKQLEKVLQNAADLYGSVKGIAGSSVGEIKRLEFPQNFLEEDKN